MNDREMIEMAARAIGRKVEWVQGHALLDNGEYFSPLTDDGDCARLEAELGINIAWFSDRVKALTDAGANCKCEFYSDHDGDKAKARRYASPRCAAEIGKAMEQNK